MRQAIALLVMGLLSWSCRGDGSAAPEADEAGEVQAANQETASQEAAAQPRYPRLEELLPENPPWKGDLDGIGTLYVRSSSSYRDSLDALNAQREKRRVGGD